MIGLPEFILILVLVFIIFGAGKLPGVGKALGQGVRELKESLNESENEKIKSENS